jgi:glutamate dehydrogenase
MPAKTAELEPELIDSVCARIHERLPDDQASRCSSFVRQYYRWVPPDDVADMGPLDLYGAAVAHWNLAQHRPAGVTKLHVYNPDFEHHGWQSGHTVIEIVSDDVPFLVDSVTMELSRHGYGIHVVIHPVIRVRRDADGQLIEILEPGAHGERETAESVLHVEVDRETGDERLERLRTGLQRVLGDVRAAVEDWQPMRERAEAIAADLGERFGERGSVHEAREAEAFLGWLADEHFTFLGYREYELVDEDGEGLRSVPGSGLGILRGESPQGSFKKLPSKQRERAREPTPLVLTKANSRSTVHRPAYLDYVGVKRFGDDGEVTGERRFLGLYTSSAYKSSPAEIPLLRGKVAAVLTRAGFPPDSHDAKALTEIIDVYPRDSLLQIGPDELFDVAMGMLALGERQRVRLFARRDPLERFVSCLVFIPRDRFNTDNREKVGEILKQAYGADDLDWSLLLSESVLVRVHYVVHTPGGPADPDVAEVERRLVQATRAWSDDLRDALTDEHGEERGGELYKTYAAAFPPAYQADWVARSAVVDIGRIDELAGSDGLVMSLYRPLEADQGLSRCKLFSADGVSLSDVLPTFEHMGAKVVDERPYEIKPRGRPSVFVYDFGLRCLVGDAERAREDFQDTFLGVWRGELEDDRLNGLVLSAGLTGRQVTILRTAAKYLRQTGIAFSDAYMERTLINHSRVASLLVALFNARFDVEHRDQPAAERIEQELAETIDAVESLDQDRILRSFLAVLQATVRTNYFRRDRIGGSTGIAAGPRTFLSLKLDPSRIPILPQPRPWFEVFVYSPHTEGVHLRGGNVARGGLRWSDRREDFRTEVLGLMKAQMVKNALIVPVGSKGGFVVKRPPAGAGREELREEVIRCYRTFISGLLDLTDNIVQDKVVPPPDVVRYDADDPYLVVAADKGTASFSDVANDVSADYRFWLGDAFASGGSHGYDHKQMGITARGAWVSVARHFRELGVHVQSTDFSVVGIGDMSGDVFGNGMLLSPHIKLVAAFNHLHIFLDPDPDPEASFRERGRLFELGRGSWDAYDAELISEGGGVYPRSAKSIAISAQAREVLGIEAEKLAPQDLIRALLKAPVELLWNGGIGTYAKAATETHADAGDKTNDAVRVDGGEVRARVVGEGGNLGFTQRARIEYTLRGGADGQGGRINTDAVDNVAGVNCSDHEVNIKILLDAVVRHGDLTEKQRNELLVEMTDEVAEAVLYGSYTQTQALSMAIAQAGLMADVHARMVRRLEHDSNLDRELEALPSDKTISERKRRHQGFLAPELAVVMAHSKIHLNAALLETDLPEDDYLRHDLERYFPAPLPERFGEPMREHRLRREIIATLVANQLVDRAGTTFAFRLWEETGAPASDLARAYAVSREVYEMRDFWRRVEALDNEVDAAVQVEMLIEGRRLVERATRWLVRANRRSLDIRAMIENYAPATRTVYAALPEVLEGDDRVAFEQQRHDLHEAGVPDALATRVAAMRSLFLVLDIAEVERRTGRSIEAVTGAYFRLGARLELDWLRDRIIELPRGDRWQALARAALRDDLYSLYRAAALDVLSEGAEGQSSDAEIDAWMELNQSAVSRCLGVLADIRATRVYDTTTLPVALRELRNLIQGAAAER